MANLAVTDLTFAIRKTRRLGGTRGYRESYGTILVPAGGPDYAAGGIPISGVTNSATGAVQAATALACPGLGCPNELVSLTILANGNGAGLDDASIVLFDSGIQADGTAPTAPHKLRIMKTALPAGSSAANTVASLTAEAQAFTGTAAGQTFSGVALTAHRHSLFIDDPAVGDAQGTRVNADATNGLWQETAEVTVPGVADTTGDGGIVDITAGTPAGTNGTSTVTGTNGSSAVTGTLTAGTFTGTASVDRKLIEHTNGALNEALTIYVLATGW